MSNGSLNGRRRAVITGLGMVSPLGNDVESSWEALVGGESGAAEITSFDHSDYGVHFACELKEFDPTVWIDRKRARRMDRFAQMILASARQAEQDSGVEVAGREDRIGASIATGIGGLKSFQDCYDTLRDRGPDRVSPFSIPSIIRNMGAGWVSIELGTKGPLMSACTACAASNMAIGDALDAIRVGRADVMFAGGTEAPITEVGIAGFDAMRALSRRNDDPKRASRPFDGARRCIRDARDQERARRGERGEDAGVVDEGGHGPLLRSCGCDRGGVHDDGGDRRRAAADDQIRVRGSRVRPRLHPERIAGCAGHSRRTVELVRLRWPQRINRD